MSPNLCVIYFLIGLIYSSPPIHGLKTSGILTEPSACCICSTNAGKTRDVARPEPFKVLANLVLPVALSRVFPALVEQMQQAEGSVKIPEVLRPWMGGLEYIKPIKK